MEADIIPHNVKKGEELGALLKFFENFAALGREDRVQAFVLGSMLFTLVIWVFAILQLLIGGTLYIIYLCHVIGSESGLYGYCKVRVDEKLGDIVASNHRKELARQQKADTSKLGGTKGSGNPNPILARQPTVPLSLLGESGVVDTNGNRLPKLPNVTELEKPASVASPIETQSRMGSISSDQRRPYGPTRSATSATNDSSRNLLSDQASMGYSGRGLERNPSSTAASIYTQRHGYDNYGNPESPLSMIAPTISAPSVGRPTPTPSRQQMRPPPPLAQQGYWGNGGMRNIPGMHGQQQQQYSRQGRAYFGNYDNHSICDSPSEYGYSGSQYDGYDYNRYEDSRMYPGPYNNNSQIAIQERQEYSRTQTRNSQRPYEGYNSSAAATPAPPPQSAYAPPQPPPPLSRAFPNTSNPQELDASSSLSRNFTNTSNPQELDASSSLSRDFTNTSNPQELDASSSLSRNQSLTSRPGADDSRSIHSQSHQRFLSDFDFELETKDDRESSGAGELGMEIEMTPQTPIIGVACTEGEVAGDPEREGTRSPGVFTETSTFAGAKSSRTSEELVRPTSSKSSNNTATNIQEPAQQQYTAYNPLMNITSSISRNPTDTQSPPTPLRRASTTTVDNSIGPIGYLNSASTPRRAGTAPPTAGTSAQQERAPVDYFGTERTPMRVGTTPPMSRNSQGRNLTSFPREQGEGMRRAETMPVESPPWGRRERRGPMYPRGEGEDIV